MLLAADLCLFAYEEHSRWESAAMARGLSSEAVRELYCRTAAGYAGLDIADAAEKIRQVTEPLETRTDLTDEEVVLLTFVEPLIREESSYPEYLAQIQKNADVIGQISIFRTSGSFVMRSLDKTVSDYAPLAGMHLTAGDYSPVTLILSHRSGPVIVLILILFFLLSMTESRRVGMWTAEHAAPGGRGRLFFSRLAALAVYVLIITSALYASEWLYTCQLYGTPQLQAAVQSVAPLQQIASRMTIRTFLAQALLMKYAALLVCALAAWLILESCSFFPASVGFLAILFGLEYTAYRLIPVQSALNWLYYVNLFQGLLTFDPLRLYVNLNFFGFPVSVSSACKAAGVIFCAASSSAVWSLYEKKHPGDRSYALLKLSGQLAHLSDRFFQRMPAWAMDVHKSLKTRGGAFLLIVLFLLTLRLLPQVVPYREPVENLLAQTERKLTGVWDSDAVSSWIASEDAAVQEGEAEYADRQKEYETGQIDETTWYIAQYRHARIALRSSCLERMRELTGAAQTLEADRGIRIWILPESDWDALIGRDRSTPVRYSLYALFLCLSVTFLQSGVYAYETECLVAPLLRLSHRGDQIFYVRTQKILLAFCALLPLAVHGPDLLQMNRLYHFTGIMAPVQSLSWLRDAIFPIPIAGFLVFIFGLRFLGLAVLGEGALLISLLCTKTRQATLISLALTGALCIWGSSRLRSFLFFDPYGAVEGRRLGLSLMRAEAPALVRLVVLLAILVAEIICIRRVWLHTASSCASR
jgi:hypothetical protein